MTDRDTSAENKAADSGMNKNMPKNGIISEDTLNNDTINKNMTENGIISGYTAGNSIIIEGYTDVHSHILPGVDDGAEDMAMSLAMADMAYEQGVRTMIATPHYYPGHMRYRREHLEKVYMETAAAVRERHADFTLLLGNEIYYREGVVERLKSGSICTMAGTGYVLLEFSPGAEYAYINGAVHKCLDAGYCPILAHMERYACLWKDGKRIRDLIRTGAYMQMNAENFEGGPFSAHKRACLKLIRSGLIHFIGSDCHNTDGRKPDLGRAFGYLKGKLPGTQYDRLAWDDPRRLLEDRYL